MQVFDVLSPFLFAKAASEEEIAHLPSSHALSRLIDDKHGVREKVFRFFATVHARTIVDMARSHPQDFIRQWCASDKAKYEPWDALDERCLAREDLDLLYAGIVSCKMNR